jgi:hypothetical protein
MKMRLFATTAISAVLATAAFGQSPTNAPTNSTTPPSQNQPSQNQPSSTTNQSTTPPSSSTSPSAQSGQTSSPPAGTAAQNSPAGGANPNPAQSAGSTTPNANSTSTSQAPAGTNAPSQAQTAPASPAPSQQSNNPAPATSNQAQQAPSNTGAASQPPNAAGNTAQSSSTNVNASVNINDQQRTRISQSVARLDVRPLTNVNFSLSVGTVVPRDVRLATLPADVIEIVPQYRGYGFVLVKDEIVIVEPSTYKIVATLPYSGGGSAAAAPARERSKVSFSDRDREVIRKHAKTRAESRTTGSAVRSEIRIGERVPESVEIEALPDEVYRESPSLREYRYIHRDNRSYVVDPRERTIIEEID